MSDGGLRPPPASTDAELAARLRSGDADGLGELYARHARAIHDFLARVVRDAPAAADLTSATFLRAWGRRETLRDLARVRSWLFAIAYGLGVDHITRNRPVVSIDVAAGAEIEAAGRGSEEAAVAQEISDLVWAAAFGLAPRQYAILDLSVRQELSSHEIADALEVPVARAWELVHRAREALGSAVRNLLVARQRDQCEGLATLVPREVDVLMPQLRGRVDHHMRQCTDCRALALRLTSPAELLPALTPLPLPAALAAEGPARLLARIHAAHGAAAGRVPPRARQAIAAAAVLAVLLAGAAYLFGPVGAKHPVPLAPRPVVPAPAVAAVPPPLAVPPSTRAPVPTARPTLAPSALALPPTATFRPVATSSPPEAGPALAPTPAPVPPFAVVAAAVQNGADCEPETLLSTRFVCAFTVQIQVADAAGHETVSGTLTVTDAQSGTSAAAQFQARVTSPGTSTLSVHVTVRFLGCPEGTASVSTQPAGPAAGPASYGSCGLL